MTKRKYNLISTESNKKSRDLDTKFLDGYVKFSLTIELLPNELTLYIASFLDGRSFFDLIKTSKALYQLRNTKEGLQQAEHLTLHTLGFDSEKQFVLIKDTQDYNKEFYQLNNLINIANQLEKRSKEKITHKYNWLVELFNQLDLSNFSFEIQNNYQNKIMLLEMLCAKVMAKDLELLLININPYIVYYIFIFLEKHQIKISPSVIVMLLEALILKLETDVRFMLLVKKQLYNTEIIKNDGALDLQLKFRLKMKSLLTGFLSTTIDENQLYNNFRCLYPPSAFKLKSTTIKSFLPLLNIPDRLKVARSDLSSLVNIDALVKANITSDLVIVMKNTMLQGEYKGKHVEIDLWNLLTKRGKFTRYVLHHCSSVEDFIGENQQLLIFLHFSKINSANIFNSFSFENFRQLMRYPFICQTFRDVKKIKPSSLSIIKEIIRRPVVSDWEVKIFFDRLPKPYQLERFIAYQEKYYEECKDLTSMCIKMPELFRLWVNALWKKCVTIEAFHAAINQINFQVFAKSRPQAIGRIMAELLFNVDSKNQLEAYQLAIKKVLVFLHICDEIIIFSSLEKRVTFLDLLQSDHVLFKQGFDGFIKRLFDFLDGAVCKSNAMSILLDANIVGYLDRMPELDWCGFFDLVRSFTLYSPGFSYDFLAFQLPLIKNIDSAETIIEEDEHYYSDILLSLKKPDKKPIEDSWVDFEEPPIVLTK